MNRVTKTRVDPLYGWIVPVVLLITWFWLYNVKGKSNSFVANPFDVLGTLLNNSSAFARNAGLSLFRLFVGVLVGTVFGAAFGIALARVARLRKLFSPTLQTLSSIPFMVVIPFFLMAFGFGEVFRISVITASTFLLVNAQAFYAVRQLNPDYFELAAIYEKSPWQLVKQVLVPASLPAVVTALRFSLLLAWLAVALAEKAVAQWPNGGLGYYVLRAKEQGQYPDMFASVIVLAILAWALDQMVAWLQRGVSHWLDTLEAVDERVV
jgi:sulfonate transport system permease protein